MDESVQKHFDRESETVAPQRITKLSQAIREGAKLRPQCHGFMFDGRGTCAIGAAVHATTGYMPPLFSGFVGWRDLQERFDVPMELIAKAAEKNDKSYWTREAIADWLESQGY